MFSQSERQIFEYRNWDGKPLFADPAEALRRIKEHTKGEFSKAVADLQSLDHETSSAAVELLKGAALYGFSVQPFDVQNGSGWLEAHLLGLIDQFNKYINGLKKNTKP